MHQKKLFQKFIITLNEKLLNYFKNYLSPNIIYGSSITIEGSKFFNYTNSWKTIICRIVCCLSQTAGIIIFETNILLISTPSALIPFISFIC